MENRVKIILAILVVILSLILIWGGIGASKVETIRYSCDFGFEDGPCWKWHENSVLEIINEGARNGIDRFFGER